MHMNHSRSKEAVEYLNKAIGVARLTKDDRTAAFAAGELTEIYRLLGESFKAVDSYAAAREIFTEI